MRFGHFCTSLLTGAFFVCMFFERASAQAPSPALREVIAALDSTAPLLAEARAEMAQARAAWTGSRAFPNPALFATQEALNDAANTTERVLGVRQNFGFLWSYSAQSGAARAAYDVEQARYIEARQALAAEVAIQAYEFDRLMRQIAAMDSVLAQAERLAAATSARRVAGDAAPYDELRIQLEVIQLQQQRVELEREAHAVLTELVTLTGRNADELSALRLFVFKAPDFATEADAANFAHEHRAVLTEVKRNEDAGRKTLAAAKWNQLPDFSLGIGTKAVVPGDGGVYFEGELEIPLWSQRRSARHAAASALYGAERARSAVLTNVDQEVRSAFKQWQLVETLSADSHPDLADSAIVNMGRGARLYLEGEMAALELIDALRTGIEAQDAALKMRNAVAEARVNLRRAVGLDILEN